MDSRLKIKTFRPSWAEFKDFKEYITKIEGEGANKAGICRIIPPPEFRQLMQKTSKYDPQLMGKIKINRPLEQVHSAYGKVKGVSESNGTHLKSMTVRQYKEEIESPKYAQTPQHKCHDDLASKFWKSLVSKTPTIYGAGVNLSLMDSDIKYWNLGNLGTELDLLDKEYNLTIEGVNTCYLYFGSWRSNFPWHTEDQELYSINYLHFGEPKSWYAVPPAYGHDFEALAQTLFPEEYEECPGFLRHKMHLISPDVLEANAIPVDMVTQEAGEFIITFPFGYHAGFNHGFNLAEATNFAMPRWIEYGKRSVPCTCPELDNVQIDMDAFVKKLQPKLYRRWKTKRDLGYHPEDPSKKLSVAFPGIIPLRPKSKASRSSGKKRDLSTRPVIRKRDVEEEDEGKTKAVEAVKVDPVESPSRKKLRFNFQVVSSVFRVTQKKIRPRSMTVCSVPLPPEKESVIRKSSRTSKSKRPRFLANNFVR